MSYTLRDAAFDIDPFGTADLPYGWLYPVAAPVVADVVIVGGRRLPTAETKPRRTPKRYRLVAEAGPLRAARPRREDGRRNAASAGRRS